MELKYQTKNIFDYNIEMAIFIKNFMGGKYALNYML